MMGVSYFDCPESEHVRCILGKVLREVGHYSFYRTEKSGPWSSSVCHLFTGSLSCDSY